MALLEVGNLTFTYPGAAAPALRSVGFALENGDFAALCGPSGGGKSTLLRLLKPGLAPGGTQSGTVLFEGTPLQSLPDRRAAEEIGFVGQDPAAQIVTDKVWHELTFAMESLGVAPDEMHRRAAEVAAFFGIQTWFHRRTDELSGGQQQLLNLAAVMTLQPKLLLLDEPTAQLDPIAAAEFLDVLQKLNGELGVTILLCEHRLENVLPLCGTALVLDGGALLCSGDVPSVGRFLSEQHHPFALALPTAMRVFAGVKSNLPCPVSVRQGQEFLREYAKTHPLLPVKTPEPAALTEAAVLEAKEVFFRYDKNAPQVLHHFSFAAHRGELLCLLGGNGAGKTTALRVLSGALSPQHGDVRCAGTAALLPQDPTVLFFKSTLSEDLRLAEPDPAAVARAVSLCRLEGLLERNPFDLSGGERQRAALAKLLLQNPDVLLLDEPTKGFDAAFKESFAALLDELKAQGVCIVMVSHDVEFCAAHADRCALLFDGAVTAEGPARSFFKGNRFYTTAARRMAHELLPEAVTANDVILSLGGVLPQNVPLKVNEPLPQQGPAQKKQPPLPLWRKVLAAVCGAGALGTLVFALQKGDLQTLTDAAGVTQAGKTQLLFYAVFFALMMGAALLLSRKPTASEHRLTGPELRGGTMISVVCVLLGVPTLLCGVHLFGTRGFYYSALALLLEAMLPFFLRFEQRKPSAQELAVLASLCALNIAGRAAFFMLPQFKPVLALTVLVGAALGTQRGFLVGAVTMLVSNVLFSQGPWTPWQMFAMGLVGALAGWLARWGVLHRSRLSLSVFGAVSALLVYGGILNPASALLWGGEVLNAKILLSYYVTGLPMDLVHACASFFFLWVLSEPMLEQLSRVRLKLDAG